MARFLVIDDDATIREMMTVTLETAGHEVTAAATGPDGVALFRARPPDAVIADILLPDDGIEPVIELRNEYPSVPFMVVSGLSAGSTRSQEIGAALGARRILTKPFRLADFLGAVDEFLAEHKIPLPAPKRKR